MPVEITLAELAALVGGELNGPGDRKVSGLKGIEDAGPTDASFIANRKYSKYLDKCQAGVVLVHRDEKAPEGLAVIRCEDPYLAYAKLLTAASKRPYVASGVHEKAHVDETASLGGDVSIHALAYVGPDAKIGDRVVLHPGAHVGKGCTIGNDTVLNPNVTVYHGCRIGERCIIHAGTVIGADGYGFVPEGDGYFKIPQLGIVEIGDDVEIGAQCAVDRATTGATRIENGVKIDNLVQVAHNCVIGENTLLVAQVGIAGSTKVGKGVILGGQVGVNGHITIGDGAKVAAQAGVTQSVDPGEVLMGSPAWPRRFWMRNRALIRRLQDLFDRVKKIESRLDEKN